MWFSPKRRPCNERQRRPRRNNLVAARRFYSLWSVSGLSANFAPRTTGSSTRTKHQAKLHVRFFRRTYRPYISFGILARFRRLPNARGDAALPRRKPPSPAGTVPGTPNREFIFHRFSRFLWRDFNPQKLSLVGGFKYNCLSTCSTHGYNILARNKSF